MIQRATIESYSRGNEPRAERLRQLEHEIQHAVHLLPTQNPIQVFVHHNTLHAFEDEPFGTAVLHASRLYGCQPYLAEAQYREHLASGRITLADLTEVLTDDLQESAAYALGELGSRYELRLAMLRYPLATGSEAELRWLIAETEALRRFGPHTGDAIRRRLIDDTRRWALRDLRPNGIRDRRLAALACSLFESFDARAMERWSAATWEAFALESLWRVCHAGVHGVRRAAPQDSRVMRHRDLLLAATGEDTDRLVNEHLIRFCGAFLDQGVAAWTLPDRDAGFMQSWLGLYRGSRPIDRWLVGLPGEIRRIEAAGLSPLELIDESLELLGVSAGEHASYLAQTLLALRGWAGMLWQMESNAEWTPHPAPAGSLVEYLAVRLVLERLAIQYTASTQLADAPSLSLLRGRLQHQLPHAPRVRVEQRALSVFQLAQVLGWTPQQLYRQRKRQWETLVAEIEAFNELERRRVFHLAYERRFRVQTLDAILAHGAPAKPAAEPPRLQFVCCIDDREESFRRHLEEVEPCCETFGVAGFYGVAMYYRGIADAHYVPLCPVVVKPRHYVREEVLSAYAESHRRRSQARRAVGHTRHRLHVGTRGALGGALAALGGTIMSAPLIARVLVPRLAAQLRGLLAHFVRPPQATRLVLERAVDPPACGEGHHGYSLDEMAAICTRVLQDIGLTERMARLVMLIGHGSSSLNNPHASAYDCGACGGGRGGPNARALSTMLNDARVRERLQGCGLCIPPETVFVGAFHNTCDDSVQYADLNRLPESHREDFSAAERIVEEACRRNAHERCRRFESAELSISSEAALRHVQARSEDLSQVRPELGHATNAICFVGRRARTRGLFLDRRAFLTSYDPAQDADGTILERTLQAVIPVCAGISLEYYFSLVDSPGYGCGSKLPHNIASLIGVMDGAASDLRTGIPWQMVEIHEPLRILFVIESTTAAVLGILERNAALDRLVRNEWIQLAVLAPYENRLQVFHNGAFAPYRPESTTLPVAVHSRSWYRGWRNHLGFASIVGDAAGVARREPPA